MSLESPDGSHRVTWAKRDAFPRLDVFDPAIVVRWRLRRADTGAIVAQQSVALDEDSDFTWDPAWPRGARYEWSDAGVYIRGYDNRNGGEVVGLRFR